MLKVQRVIIPPLTRSFAFFVPYYVTFYAFRVTLTCVDRHDEIGDATENNFLIDDADDALENVICFYGDENDENERKSESDDDAESGNDLPNCNDLKSV